MVPLHEQHAACDPHVTPPHTAPPQKPNELHVPSLHVPHDPPQPSSPHVAFEQSRLHSHLPDALHDPNAHVPHEPPHPSGPHTLPLHFGVQVVVASLPESVEPASFVVPLDPLLAPLEPLLPALGGAGGGGVPSPLDPPGSFAA
jgi:hypothetical protein